MKNKKGSLAFEFVYALAFLFSLGLLYIMFNQAIDSHLVPTLTDSIPNDNPDKAEFVNTNNEWLSYWQFLPILVLMFILLYMIVSGIRQGRENRF